MLLIISCDIIFLKQFLYIIFLKIEQEIDLKLRVIKFDIQILTSYPYASFVCPREYIHLVQILTKFRIRLLMVQDNCFFH